MNLIKVPYSKRLCVYCVCILLSFMMLVAEFTTSPMLGENVPPDLYSLTLLLLHFKWWKSKFPKRLTFVDEREIYSVNLISLPRIYHSTFVVDTYKILHCPEIDTYWELCQTLQLIGRTWNVLCPPDTLFLVIELN